MKKHTPGPWRITYIAGSFDMPGRYRVLYYDDLSSRDVAEVHEFGPEDSDEAHANAILISAATELLEALSEISDAFEALGISGTACALTPAEHATLAKARAAIAKARAAIAKAEGR